MTTPHHPGAVPRLPDWRERLAAVIAHAHRQRYALAAHDCCLLACASAGACTGVDPAAPYRADHTGTPQASAALLRRLGGLRGVGSRCGAPIAPGVAREGDIGLVVGGGARPRLAVCAGAVWLSPASHGLHAAPFGAAVRAWKVGA